MIARLIVQEPEILLLDEPTASIDYKMTEELMKLVQELHKKQGLTVIKVNHNIKLLQD